MPEPPAGSRTLDIGCGAGQTIVALDGSHSIIGLDVDFRALTIGKKLDTTLRFVNGACEFLPFSDETFEYTYSRGALPYMNIVPALREIRRVLRPGGELWASFHNFSAFRRQHKCQTLKSTLYFTYVLVSSLLFHLTGHSIALSSNVRESFQTTRGIRAALESSRFELVAAYNTERHFWVRAKAV